jgi:DNA-binding CsgD family transcriptional regulator
MRNRQSLPIRIQTVYKLTTREQEVVAHIRAGTTSTAAIAAALNIKQNTAKAHIQNIMRKLGVKRRRHIVARLEASNG